MILLVTNRRKTRKEKFKFISDEVHSKITVRTASRSMLAVEMLSRDNNYSEYTSQNAKTFQSAVGSVIRPTEHDINTTIVASQVIFACGTGVFYLVTLTLSICGVWIRAFATLCSSRGTFFVFFIGALVASINVFTYSDNMLVKVYFRPSVVSIIGIVFTLFGAMLFFQLRGHGTNEPTLGRQQPCMGVVVGCVTFPLFVLELVLLALAFNNKAKAINDSVSNGEAHIQWILMVVDKILFLVQKPIQLAIYLYLRHTIPCSLYRENAQFYLRIISFFNLIEWVDSQVNVDDDFQLSRVQDNSGWSDVMLVTYKALIIDYRLLCCLLFLEHSLELQTCDYGNVAGGGVGLNGGTTNDNMTDGDGIKMCSGFFAGAACLIAPVFCGLHYVHDVQIGASVQISAIIVDAAIILLGICLLHKNSLEAEDTREPSAVKVMVCCFGAVGFICWMVQGAIAGFWAATAHGRSDVQDPSYMAWDSAKFTVRGLTTAFLMFMFMKINARALPQQNPDVKMNHFCVPVVMSGILSAFVDTLIDQYVGPMDSAVRCEIKEQSLKILLEVGPPMYLGFLIHVFLHFVIIETKIGKQRTRGRVIPNEI